MGIMVNGTNWQLAKYRSLLLLQARQLQQDRRLLVRFDCSDLVQQALLEAHGDLAQFKGKTEAELIQWLRQILTHTAIDSARHDRAGRRDVRLERTLEMAVADSSACLDKFLAGRSPSPSEQIRKQEFQVRLAEAIEQLPPRQRDVFIGRDVLGKSILDLAADLKLTREAVVGLLNRAHRKLCQLMAPFEDANHGRNA
jgi:RNA polymerase sigma-70 factor (ECF subfamily)